MRQILLFGFSIIVGIVLLINLSAFKNNISANNPSPNRFILLEIYEIPGYKDKGVHIHWGTNKTEIVPFREFSADNHDDNGEIILNSINKLIDMGYDVEHMSSGLASEGMITKIFMRKSK